MAAALISYTHTETQRQKAFDSTSCGFIPSTQSILETFPSRERETPLFFTYPSPGDLPLESLLRPDKGGTFVFHHLFNISHELTHTHTNSRAFYGVIEHKDIFVALSDMYITK